MSSILEKIGVRFSFDYADVRFERRTGLSISIKEGKIEKFESYYSSGYAIRILKDGIIYHAFLSSSHNLDDISFKEFRRSSWVEKLGLEDIRVVKDKVIIKPAKPLSDVDISEKMELLKELDSIVDNVGVKKRTLTYTEFTAHKLIEDVNGLRIEMEIPYALIRLFAIGRYEGKSSEIRRTWGIIGGWENIDIDNIREFFEESAKSAIESAKARSPKTGKYNVVIDGDLNHLLAHEALGHASEADLLKIRSILQGKTGKRIASPLIDVIDDGRFEHNGAKGFGWIPYDDEGVPSSRTYIIREGKMMNFLTNRETAKLYNFKLTGNGRAQSWNHRVIVRMTNTLIIPSKQAEPLKNEELLEILKEGLLLKFGHGGQTNPSTGIFTFGVQEVYLVKQGEIVERLGRTSISGNILVALKNVIAVGKEYDRPEISAGFCGKDEQIVPVGASGVWLLIKDMHVGG